MAARDELALQFTESMGRFFESAGVPRMAGRVWAYLLIAEGPHLSAGELAHALGASPGSISGATRSLLEFGLIDRVRVRGERRDYFAPRRGTAGALLRRLLERLTAIELVISDALEAFADREHTRRRLEEIHDLYHWYARELDELNERYRAEQRRAGRPAPRE